MIRLINSTDPGPTRATLAAWAGSRAPVRPPMTDDRRVAGYMRQNGAERRGGVYFLTPKQLRRANKKKARNGV